MNPYDQHDEEGLFDELRPIFKHTAIVLTFLGSLFLVAVMAEWTAHSLPNHRESIDKIEAVDFMVVFVLLCIYGAHTIVRTIIWAVRDLLALWSKPPRRRK